MSLDAEWTVAITGRGEDAPVYGEIPFSSLNWGRVLDDLSVAQSVTPVGDASDETCDILRQVRPWVHELRVYADGNRGWVGPVRRVELGAESVTIDAADLGLWLERRSYTGVNEWFGTDLTDIAVEVIRSAFLRDNSPGLVVNDFRSNVSVDWTIDTESPPRCADELRSLARAGLDYVVIGRHIVLGGDDLPIGAIGILPTEAFVEPRVTIEGDAYASEITVVGNDDAGSFYASAGGVDLAHGLVEQVYASDNVYDTNMARLAAEMRLDIQSIEQLRPNLQFDVSTDIEYDVLIPGAVADLRVAVGCIELIGEYRLMGLNVQVDANEQGVTTQATPTFALLSDIDAFEE